MRAQPVSQQIRTAVGAVVPALTGWRTFPRAASNLLLVVAAALLGVWGVHQTEYALEYGGRFSAVMADTPHRYYMAPAGLLLLVLGGALVALLILAVQRAQLEIGRIRLSLPPRLARRLQLPGLRVSARSVIQTAILLAVCQIAVYTLQENLEGAVVTGLWPGLAVLFAPQHLTVIPLHLLVALCSSLLLWTAYAWLHRARREARLARILAGIAAAGGTRERDAFPGQAYLPSRQILSGALGLRAPPLAA